MAIRDGMRRDTSQWMRRDRSTVNRNEEVFSQRSLQLENDPNRICNAIKVDFYIHRKYAYCVIGLGNALLAYKYIQ